MRVRVTLKENFHSLVNSCTSCLKVIRRIGHNKKKKYLVEITRGVVQIFVISRRLSLRIRGIASILFYDCATMHRMRRKDDIVVFIGNEI